MRLDHYLVVNRWLSQQLGADGIEDLKHDFFELEPGVDGESPFLRALLDREGVALEPERLTEYDERIREYEGRLATARGGAFGWKYFQYLALLHLEIFLDALTSDPSGFRRTLDGFLEELVHDSPHLDAFSPFEEESLRQFALYMATGSGKTLLLHANIWQAHHYLEHGAHPAALVRRIDGRREFDNVVLITPNEGLSAQHIAELRASGIDAVHLAYDEPSGWLFGPQVRVIEISKLRPAEEVSGDGLSISLESLGGQNLVLVDEGHKGVGADAQVWKERQRALSGDGVLMEYSATFAQSVAAAPKKAEARLLEEYGKSIAFDYSYRHFYNDGYGKHFEVLNLTSDSSDRAQDLLVGGLLTFYQQVHLFRTRRSEFHPFEIEPPLWVFLGARVIKTGKSDLGEVAQIIAFLKRFLEDSSWARSSIERVLSGNSGFEDADGQDLFAGRLGFLEGSDIEALYEDILDRVFHGLGSLEIWELKRADGEIALRAGTSADGDPSYFGLINVGDSAALRRHLERNAGVDVHADEFTDSLFPTVDTPESTLNVLIGSRKFIEGWSSWRVSTMGLLNMGRGAGPQVIQLFGRGVRLKGRDRSLRRSTGRGLDESELPDGLGHLETLYIFGWNADYISAFRKMLVAEEVGWEVEVPVRHLDPIPELYVPQPATDSGGQGPWTLQPGALGVRVDLTSRLSTMVLGERKLGAAADSRVLDFSASDVAGLVDVNRLYLDLLAYKSARGYEEMLVRPQFVLPILAECDIEVDEPASREPDRVQEAAWRALKVYADRAAARAERAAQSERMQPIRLEVREKATRPYRVRGSDPDLREEILELIAERDRLYSTGEAPLPRLHVERHLFSPLLLDPKRHDVDISVSPAGLTKGEGDFVNDLVTYWERSHEESAYADVELFLLRNLPHSGVGFFQRSGFYPDFMLWVRGERETRLTFIEPHGMHHGGLAGNRDKIASFAELEEISERPEFQKLNIRMNGYILTETERGQIPDADGLTWKELEEKFHILSQDVSGYIATVLRGSS